MSAGESCAWIALFPGQGSQQVGMGAAMSERWPEAADVFREADDVLGEPLSRLCFEGPEEQLSLTRNTQPALLTVSIAAWRVVSGRVPAPVAAAGHSLGEWSALVASGVLRFDDALRAVRLRGEAMQQAVPVGAGAMAAVVGPNAHEVVEMCATVRTGEEILVPANFNAPDQTVVAGHRSAVERLVGRGKELGARRVIALPVSAPFHCPLMEPAARTLEAHLAGLEFGEAAFPVVANVDAEPVEGGEAARGSLVRQVASPVRWVDTMLRLAGSSGASLAAELGAGRVLAGLARRTCPELSVIAAGAPEDLESLLDGLGATGEARR
jgi:[acyl-carrier-protein] S-malonyltransferase